MRNRKGDNDGGRRENCSKTSFGETSFSPQNSLKRLAAGLRPNPLGELSAPPNPLAVVSIVVEWIFPSGYLVAFRNVLLQGHRRRQGRRGSPPHELCLPLPNYFLMLQMGERDRTVTAP